VTLTKPRYVDVTGAPPLWPRFAAHAVWLDKLAALGFARLCAVESDLGMTWSVVRDESQTVAISVTIVEGHVSLYAATVLEDRTVLETQWLPRLPLLVQLGPGTLRDDVPARRWKRFTRRGDVERLVAAHGMLVAAHARRSPASRWTPEGYLRFRLSSRWVAEINMRSTSVFAAFLSVMALLATASALLAVRPGWVVAGLILGAFFLSHALFGYRVLRWVGAIAVRSVAVHVREGLWKVDSSIDDDP
jgi:hypothetical protein